ncbi:uncharacterized protein [Watersipora subatra]|uniref:uncharacterized protein n=1 Tax=Watersipora subatra TaxID=2589382 RepID=UPI00355C5E3E
MIASQSQDISNLALGNLQATQHALTDTMGTLAISQKNAGANFAEEGRKLTGRKPRNQTQHGGWAPENRSEHHMFSSAQRFAPHQTMHHQVQYGSPYQHQNFIPQGQPNHHGFYSGPGMNPMMPGLQTNVRSAHMNHSKHKTFPPKNALRSAPVFRRSLSTGSSPINHHSVESVQHLTTRSMSEVAASKSVSLAESNNELPLSPDDGICLSPPGDAANQGLGLVGKTVECPDRSTLATLDEESDSDTDITETHPNKFPIAIEMHTNRNCGYKRQPIRSGPQVKVIKSSGESYNVNSPTETPEVDQEFMRRYYRKDLVRLCVCGRYDTKEPLLENRGRDNDADGYEVHYSIKCRWKSYEDFKTKTRVIIRLCKCYKPSF